ncbi:fibroblast growth factor receptor 4-like isoform X2 [Stylophora pistillata]|uniref:fibroblast growth factor receptor 4-like isoform X2 n=1 Tax=Stylophora pistillata TaxID=50429 RepID=UPI000C0500CA|nr:fibroblast growth factor receptor 4-like isoform X2 [Stylophora pistillata]
MMSEIQWEFLKINFCSHQDLTKTSCKMPVVICVVLLFLEQQIGAVGGRCSSAEDATKPFSTEPTVEMNNLEFPNEHVLPTGYNITVVCTSNKQADKNEKQYKPYWIQYSFNNVYQRHLSCGGGYKISHYESPKVCNYPIQNATEKNSGNYTCKASSQSGCTIETMALTFKKPSSPLFSHHQPRKVNFIKSSRAKLSCNASGVPRPFITWFKDGDRLSSSSVEGSQGYSILNFESVQPYDQGQYWCEANSTEGRSTSPTVNLTVVWKPEFSIHPQDKTKYFDDDATNVSISFSCAANGSPLPVISWSENNSKVDDDKAIQKDNISILTLVFNEGTEKHFKYRCVAKNSLGNISSQEATLMIAKRHKKPLMTADNREPNTVTNDNRSAIIWSTVITGASIFIITVIVLLIIKWRLESRFTYQLDQEVYKRTQETFEIKITNTNDTINQLRNSLSASTDEGQLPHPSATGENGVVENETYLQLMAVDRNWEIPRDRLTISEEKLGRGEFGEVKKGIYLRTDGNELSVAVKTLKDNKNMQHRMALIKELETLIQVGRHPNIVSLVGACTFEEPLCVVIEFVSGGSLDKLLRSSRVQNQQVEPSYVNIWSRLTERELLRVASDVASGMRHLESKQCIHRDLACRNVLVGKGLIAKVADFGMARDVSADGQYIKTTEGRVPWLWMSVEALKGTCTIKGDVWSFGVTLWEIVTLGELPYTGIKGILELHELLKDGERLPKPAHCSDELYNIMLGCWHRNPEERPSFDQLYEVLEELLQQKTRTYINVTYFEEQDKEEAILI